MPFSFTFNTKTTVRRVLENPYDHYHLATLHKLPTPTTSIQVTLLDELPPDSQSEPRTKNEARYGALVETKIERYLYFGPINALAKVLGLNTETFMTRIDTWPSGHFFTIYINGKEKVSMMQGITPVGENNTTEYVVLMIKKTGSFWQDLVSYAVFGLQNKAVGAQDIPVFNTLNDDKGGAYVKHDRPALKFREFYQSWVDKVEI
ncbi:hypothetical protein [Nostoc sp. WHI]|uniref:hypothetical protein n=1 Tax=Nostoc sp. WHI TaxID=2650611 RepID=UPI0018C7220A|nr:hypothetical protein [Nostoc sp. WHI]MBG1265775.1 hypothetical protein [Nostoc sp. WHI]